MRPLARLYKHIFYEYNTDVHRLFFDLVKQTEHGEVHDSLLNALSRFVIYWCIHDSKTLKRFISLLDKSDAEDNLALGCSLILHIPSNLTATNCVHELEKISADQAANVANEERFGTSNSICFPNSELVRRLIDRGYSENAARRAVMMTGNSGYNDALGWAVMHTMDPDFNQPIAILKSNNKMYIDEEAIHLLQKSLVQISRVLEDPSNRAKLIKYIESQHGDLVTSSHGNTQAKRVNTFGMKVSPSGNPEEKVKPQAKHAPPPPPLQPQKKETEARNNSTSNQAAPSVSHSSANGFSEAVLPPTKQTVQQTPLASVNPPSQVPTATTVSRTAPQSSASATPAASNVRPAIPSSLTHVKTKALTSKPPLDRDELRRRGQEALEKLRSSSSNSGSRRRLIEEGRQLLKQKQAIKSSSSSAPVGSNPGGIAPKKVGGPGSVRPLPPAAPPRMTVVNKPATEPQKNSSLSVPKPSKAPTLRTLTKPSAPHVTKVTKIDAAEDDKADNGWDFDDF